MVKQSKVIGFIKKFWLYIVAGILVVAIGVSFGVAISLSNKEETIDVTGPTEDNKNDKEEEYKEEQQEQDEPVSNPDVLVFSMPMTNATIIKDFSADALQYNPTLDRWEAHMYIDLTSDDLKVYSILDGTVASIDYDYLTGYMVKIQHDDGFVSTYASMSENVLVNVGDKISSGQQIGQASNLGASASGYGEHLELMLTKDNQKVDPNNYLDLQSK